MLICREPDVPGVNLNCSPNNFILASTIAKTLKKEANRIIYFHFNKSGMIKMR